MGRNLAALGFCVALATLSGFVSFGIRAEEGGDVNAKISDTPEFIFARLRYDSVGGWGEAFYNYDGRTWERWETDYPQADENFAFRLRELSSVVPNVKGVTRRVTDEDLFEFPFLYMCDPGYMRLTDEEKERLRSYLLGGGFMWVDDFWGNAEWWNFEETMRDVLPEYHWREIPADHPILHNVFDLPGAPAVPARDFAVRGWKTDPPWIHKEPTGLMSPVHFRGYFDERDRLMVVATHNTDTGDGWEREAYGQWYFENYSTKAYMIGVNVVVYALSH